MKLPKLLSAAALYERLHRSDDLLLLDVRNNEAFARLRIETRPPSGRGPDTMNLPYFLFLEEDTAATALAAIPAGRPIVVVCAHGGASEMVAGRLRQAGHTAANLAGGMDAWARLHVARTVVASESLRIYQIDRVARGCLSYVLISENWAAVIDPSRHIDEYLHLLEAHGAALRMVVDTHAHADHISGGPALAEVTGAPYYLHPYDAIHPHDVLPANLAYESLRDGHRFRLGRVTIRALHVPGHTLGHVALAATTPDGDSYLFSGDSVFLRSVGRPDLGGQSEAWARLAHESLFTTLRARVPGEALVLPGHYAQPGEADGQGLFAAPFAELWLRNSDLAFAHEDDFVDHILGNLPALPPEYAEIKRVNAGLARADPQRSSVLEMGRNICALSSAYADDPASLVPR